MSLTLPACGENVGGKAGAREMTASTSTRPTLPDTGTEDLENQEAALASIVDAGEQVSERRATCVTRRDSVTKVSLLKAI